MSFGLSHRAPDVIGLASGSGPLTLLSFIDALEALALTLRLGPLAFVRAPLPLVGQLLAVVGDAVPFIRDAVPLIREAVPLIRDTVSVGRRLLAPSDVPLARLHRPLAVIEFSGASDAGTFSAEHGSTLTLSAAAGQALMIGPHDRRFHTVNDDDPRAIGDAVEDCNRACTL